MSPALPLSGSWYGTGVTTSSLGGLSDEAPGPEADFAGGLYLQSRVPRRKPELALLSDACLPLSALPQRREFLQPHTFTDTRVWTRCVSSKHSEGGQAAAPGAGASGMGGDPSCRGSGKRPLCSHRVGLASPSPRDRPRPESPAEDTPQEALQEH